MPRQRAPAATSPQHGALLAEAGAVFVGLAASRDTQDNCGSGGGRSGLCRACGHIGICYRNMGQFQMAGTMKDEDRTIAKQVGDRAQLGEACGLLGICQLQMVECITGAAFAEKQYKIGKELGLWRQRASASLAKGVALWLQPACEGARKVWRGKTACRRRSGASRVPATWGKCMERCTSRSSSLMRGRTHDDRSLPYQREHMTWRVQRARDVCNGRGKKRGEDARMLTCSSCGVARFCSADDQKRL